EIGMRAVAEADGRRGAAELLDGDHVLEIAQTRAAVLLLHGDAVQAELAHPGPQLARETIGLVELGRDRRHFGRGKALDLLAQGVGRLAEVEVERRNRIGNHVCFCRLRTQSTLTWRRTSFHSPSDGMKARSNWTRLGSVGKEPCTSSRPSSS